MKLKDITEKKEQAKLRDPNWKTLQAKRSSGAAGAHKDKKKADKQGDTKHKNKSIEEAGWRGGPKGYDSYGNPLGGGYDEYQDDPYGHKEAERNRQRREMEDSGTWYIRINGKVFKDKTTGKPAEFTGKRHANSVAVKLAAKDWNQGAKIMLSTSPNDKPEEFKK